MVNISDLIGESVMDVQSVCLKITEIILSYMICQLPDRRLAVKFLFINNFNLGDKIMRSYKNESGRSMIEMLGVLAIIGVLSVGGIAGYSKAVMKYRINKTIEQITLIAGNVRTFFASQGNYVGLGSSADGSKIVQKAKLVPDEMWNSNKTSLNNIWGGGFFCR